MTDLDSAALEALIDGAAAAEEEEEEEDEDEDEDEDKLLPPLAEADEVDVEVEEEVQGGRPSRFTLEKLCTIRTHFWITSSDIPDVKLVTLLDAPRSLLDAR